MIQKHTEIPDSYWWVTDRITYIILACFVLLIPVGLLAGFTTDGSEHVTPFEGILGLIAGLTVICLLSIGLTFILYPHAES